MWLPLLLALLAKDSLQNQNIWKGCIVLAGFMFLLQFIISNPETMLANWVRAAYRGREGYGHFGKRTLRLLDKHMLSISDVSEATVDYWSLTKIGETPAHIFIMQGPSGHVIPKATISEGSLELFIAELKARIAAAEAAHPPATADSAAPSAIPTDWWALAAFFVAAFLLVGGVLSLMAVMGSRETAACLCEGDMSLCSARDYCKIQAAFRWLIGAAVFVGLPLLGFSIYRFFFKRKRAGVAPGP